MITNHALTRKQIPDVGMGQREPTVPDVFGQTIALERIVALEKLPGTTIEGHISGPKQPTMQQSLP